MKSKLKAGDSGQIIHEDVMHILKNLDLENLRNKTLLITGSNGLIGSYIIRAIYEANKLHGLNAKVIGISRSEPNQMLSFIKDENFNFIKKNLAEGLGYNGKFDFAIHAATYAQPAKFMQNKLETIKLNTNLVEELAQKSKENNASLLFISSSEVYGKSEVIPTPEEYNGNCTTLEARSVYSESKRLGETICAVFREEGLNVKIARVSATYGPGITVNDKRVLGNFLNKALLKGHIDIMDSGAQKRTWLYVSDCVIILLKILLQGNSFVYNVGGNDTLSIKELAKLISELTGATFSAPLEDKLFMKGAPDEVKLNIAKIKNEFNISGFIPIDKGLRNTIEWNRLQNG